MASTVATGSVASDNLNAVALVDHMAMVKSA
jgi:hypothetical protein